MEPIKRKSISAHRLIIPLKRLRGTREYFSSRAPFNRVTLVDSISAQSHMTTTRATKGELLNERN
jgi:hypothetical protein